jgi:hypothetical protein
MEGARCGNHNPIYGKHVMAAGAERIYVIAVSLK